VLTSLSPLHPLVIMIRVNFQEGCGKGSGEDTICMNTYESKLIKNKTFLERRV
jgi:hypothetical protein